MLADLPSTLRNGHDVCDQAITKLTSHISTGTSGGDDIAAELLVEIWKIASKVAKQQQTTLRAEVTAGRQRAQQYERQLEDLKTTQVKRHSNSSDGNGRDSESGSLSHSRHGINQNSSKSGDWSTSLSPDITNADAIGLLSQKATEEAIKEATSELRARNGTLEGNVAALQRELAAVKQRASMLESIAATAADAESRVEEAESELEEMKVQLGTLTPRPHPEYHELRALLGEESKVELALVALEEHMEMAPDVLAAVLVAVNSSENTLPATMENTNQAVISTTITAAVLPAAPVIIAGQGSTPGPPPQAVQCSTGNLNSTSHGGIASPLTVSIPAVTASDNSAAKEEAGASDAKSSGQVTANAHTSGLNSLNRQISVSLGAVSPTTLHSPPGPSPIQQPPLVLPPSKFTGALNGIPLHPLAEILSRCRGSTARRYVSIEKAAASLRTDFAGLNTELESYREIERKREAARRRREEEAMLEKKNAVQQYLDLLSSQGEETWKEQLIGMGQGQDVPKLFRHSGKIRNKQMTKRDTEKLVKELWKERLKDPAVIAGRAAEVVDFVGAYLQKKVGIAAAVIEVRMLTLFGPTMKIDKLESFFLCFLTLTLYRYSVFYLFLYWFLAAIYSFQKFITCIFSQ